MREGHLEDLAADQEEDLAEILANHLEDLAAGQEEDLAEILTDQAGPHQKCMMLCAINAAKNAQCHSSQQAASQYTAVIALGKLTQAQAQAEDQAALTLQKKLQKSTRSLTRSCLH